jgi:diketogulonate reductase-like aldo/keto reductase
MTVTMRFKELGKTGVRIPEIGLGMWRYHGGPEPLRRGLDAGALFIDTAESYGNEGVAAEAMAHRRGRVFLATKVSPAHFRRRDLIKAADESLKRLRTDYIDLYQLHRPNDDIPVEETLGAMEDLVDAGKVRFIGVSNFSIAQLQHAQRAMHKYPIVSNQVRFNLIDRTIAAALLPSCQANGVTVIAYSPLARGFQHILDCDPRGVLASIAKATGRTPVQVALNWCLCLDGVVAIPKGNSVDHVLENCGASGWRLSPEQVHQLDESTVFKRRSGFEMFLRQHLPPDLKRGIQQLVQVLPRGLRRKIN